MGIKRLFTTDLKSKNKKVVKEEKRKILELVKSEIRKEEFVEEKLLNKDLKQEDLTSNIKAAIKQARRLNRRRK